MIIIYIDMSKIIHRFLRQPNHHSSIYSRIANRFDPFKNTLTVLEDPKANRKLYLIGTTNSSTLLAYRTQKLIRQLKPNSLYVQASPLWWKFAKHLNISTQAEFNLVSKQLPCQSYKFENNLRGILFRVRLYSWLYALRSIARFPTDFNFYESGLQAKLALQQAESLGCEKVFGGTEFDPITIEQLKTETDMYFTSLLWNHRRFYDFMCTKTNQYEDFYNTLIVKGGQTFAESIDRFRINYMVYVLNGLAPKQKKILVDKRDERIFREIYECKGQKIVGVVNQWHMQGVEDLWRRATGTQVKEVAESPIADMDIDSYQQTKVVNEFLRQFTSSLSKSEPATSQDYPTTYHKENFQYERTRHTHHTSHEDIPNPGQTHKPHH